MTYGFNSFFEMVFVNLDLIFQILLNSRPQSVNQSSRLTLFLNPIPLLIKNPKVPFAHPNHKHPASKPLIALLKPPTVPAHLPEILISDHQHLEVLDLKPPFYSTNTLVVTIIII